MLTTHGQHFTTYSGTCAISKASRRKFTGKERAEGSGNDYFDA
jgi:hypothetical protein